MSGFLNLYCLNSIFVSYYSLSREDTSLQPSSWKSLLPFTFLLHLCLNRKNKLSNLLKVQLNAKLFIYLFIWLVGWKAKFSTTIKCPGQKNLPFSPFILFCLVLVDQWVDNLLLVEASRENMRLWRKRNNHQSNPRFNTHQYLILIGLWECFVVILVTSGLICKILCFNGKNAKVPSHVTAASFLYLTLLGLGPMLNNPGR